MASERLGWAGRWKAGAGRLKREVYALFFACRNPRTPWYARVVVGLVVAYALSPIDLIPDFIPVLGYVDDLVLVPLGILLAVKLIPRDVLDQARSEAARALERPRSRAGPLVVAAVWLMAAVIIGSALYRRLIT